MASEVTEFFDKLTISALVWSSFGPDAPIIIGWIIRILLGLMFMGEICSYFGNFTKSFTYIVGGALYVIIAPVVLTIIALQFSIFGFIAMVVFIIGSYSDAATFNMEDNRHNWVEIHGERIKGHLTTFNFLYSLRVYCLRKIKRNSYIQNLIKEQQEYLDKYSHITI